MEQQKALRIRKPKPVERSVLEMAYERINTAYDLFDSIDVSFSGGKDSTAVLMLTLEVARQRGKLPLRVFFHDEEAIPFQTEAYVRRVSQMPGIALEWYCLPVKHRNACSRRVPWWSPWDPQEEELWTRPRPPEGITQLAGFRTDGEPRDRLTIPEINALLHPPQQYGRIGMMMGIRAQESLTRLRAVSRRMQENYITQFKEGPANYGQVYKVYPIYDWKTEDVWTAPAQFGWDYNHAYDVMEQEGIPRAQQRCSPAFGEEPLQRFHVYKTCFPELWEKMCFRVPGVNTAMLYSRTDIYGYGGIPEKPEGMTWQEYVLNYIGKFAPEEGPMVAERVRSVIHTHFGKTNDPILSVYPHPITGASWKIIANIAMRGDFKERRTATVTHHSALTQGKDMDEAWAEYHRLRQEEGL